MYAPRETPSTSETAGMRHESPERRALRSIAETTIGNSPHDALLAACRMRAIATAGLERAGVLGERDPARRESPLVRLGQGEYATTYPSPLALPETAPLAGPDAGEGAGLGARIARAVRRFRRRGALS